MFTPPPLYSQVLLKLAETKSTVSDDHPSQISLLHYVARAFVGATPDAHKSLRHELRALEEVYIYMYMYIYIYRYRYIDIDIDR